MKIYYRSLIFSIGTTYLKVTCIYNGKPARSHLLAGYKFHFSLKNHKTCHCECPAQSVSRKMARKPSIKI